MRPPACVRCKWGTGTTSERPSNTVAAKEVKSNFEKMMAERAKQDSLWFATKDAQIETASSPPNVSGNKETQK
jgi:hypothetical protein